MDRRASELSAKMLKVLVVMLQLWSYALVIDGVLYGD